MKIRVIESNNAKNGEDEDVKQYAIGLHNAFMKQDDGEHISLHIPSTDTPTSSTMLPIRFDPSKIDNI
jgi:hypothetical protein